MYADHTQESRMHGSYTGEPPHTHIAIRASSILMQTHACCTRYLDLLPPVNTMRIFALVSVPLY